LLGLACMGGGGGCGWLGGCGWANGAGSRLGRHVQPMFRAQPRQHVVKPALAGYRPQISQMEGSNCTFGRPHAAQMRPAVLFTKVQVPHVHSGLAPCAWGAGVPQMVHSEADGGFSSVQAVQLHFLLPRPGEVAEAVGEDAGAARGVLHIRQHDMEGLFS